MQNVRKEKCFRGYKTTKEPQNNGFIIDAVEHKDGFQAGSDEELIFMSLKDYSNNSGTEISGWLSNVQAIERFFFRPLLIERK